MHNFIEAAINFFEYYVSDYLQFEYYVSDYYLQIPVQESVYIMDSCVS